VGARVNSRVPPTFGRARLRPPSDEPRPIVGAAHAASGRRRLASLASAPTVGARHQRGHSTLLPLGVRAVSL
jgi:hypothetical protein